MDISERTWTVEAGGVIHTDFPEGTVVSVESLHRRRMEEIFADMDRVRGDRPRMTPEEIDAFLAAERASWD